MNEWPADKVERKSVAELVSYARNARTHSAVQVSQIAASIREWGWTVPILIDEAGNIIAGHGRVLAAAQLGLTDVPAMVATGWTETQRRAYVLADNKLALNAGWDQELLKLELEELSEHGFNTELIGFSEAELNSTLGLLDEKDGGSELGGDLEYRIVVDCDNEQHQARILERLESEGMTCRPLIS